MDPPAPAPAPAKASSAEGAAASETIVPAPEPQATAAPAPPAALDSPRLYVAEGLEVIRLKPDWDAPIIGLIHAGQSVRLARKEPLQGPGVKPCGGGWYAIEPRGAVCLGERSTLARDDPRVLAAAELLPELTGLLPYHVGVSTGAPRYLKIPTAEEQRRVEKDLDKHLAHLPPRDEAQGGAVDAQPAGVPPSPALQRYFALPRKDLTGDDAFAGMKVSWAKEFDAAGRTWLVAPDLTLIPKDKVRVKALPELQGVNLKAGDTQLPIAYAWLGPVHRYEKEADGTLRAGGESWPRHAFFAVTDTVVKQGPHFYVQARDGGYLRSDDVTVIRKAGGRPQGVGPHDKWVSVRVTHGYLVAYEGDTPVFTTAISPGAEGINSGGVHTTRTGLFWVKTKAISWEMSGKDRRKEWMIKDVPWVSFYEESYGLHGAWWHDDFGRPKSHGCINLSLSDAHFLFDWLDPALPQGWYVVSAYYVGDEALKGTVVEVRP